MASWRKDLERKSSLSTDKLDELEDHLRARFDLELELDAALRPAAAFAIARDELGESAALSREFAKAGKPRWRWRLMTGWALFGASFFLPLMRVEVFGMAEWMSIISAESREEIKEVGILDMLANAWRGTHVILLNLAMVMTLPALRGAQLPGERWLGRIFGVVGWSMLGFGVPHAGALLYRILSLGGLESGLIGPIWLGPGYYAWTLSFVLVGAALRIRARERMSPRVNTPLSV